MLAAPPYKEQIDWSKLHIFWGDERAVPFEDNRNNAKMAYDTLLNFVPVPAVADPCDADGYAPGAVGRRIRKDPASIFRCRPGRTRPAEPLPNSFDLVLLGMGDDGHTLSLFPGTAVVHEEKAWATAFFLKAQDMYRITLTKTIVNRSAGSPF